MTPAPESLLRRGFLYHELAALGAEFIEIEGSACAARFGDVTAEAVKARELGLCDLSPLPRTGVKGAGALAWLRAQGIEVGEEDNLAYTQADGRLVARLAATEALLLSDLGGPTDFAELEGAWSMDGAGLCYPVPRAGANVWLMVTGRHAPAMLAKLCGVDLRPRKFAPRRVAQTSLAKLAAIVIRADRGGVTAFHLLADSASAGYLWKVLEDAMTEFEGGVVGLEAVARLEG